MIYIQEHFSDFESVTIRVDGLLTGDCINTLREILTHHLEDGKKVSVNLKKLNHISREAKMVLTEFEDRVVLIY